MNEVMAGVLGGVLVLVVAAVGAHLWWTYQDKHLDRVLASLSNLR